MLIIKTNNLLDMNNSQGTNLDNLEDINISDELSNISIINEEEDETLIDDLPSFQNNSNNVIVKEPVYLSQTSIQYINSFFDLYNDYKDIINITLVLTIILILFIFLFTFYTSVVLFRR